MSSTTAPPLGIQPMKQRIKAVQNEINHGLIERGEILNTALLTVLTGEHLVLIGPPGTAKSAIARRISDCFSYADDESYFEYLLTKFSTPEEIFGPLSIAELRADRFRRNTSGYLPAARIGFLDEIFKANSSILNSLLTILNERIFHNGSEPQQAPLLSLISASNELPVGVEELNALYDRFLVRVLVNPVSERGRGSLFDVQDGGWPFNPAIRISQAEVETCERLAREVTIPDGIRSIILDIWAQHQKAFQEDRRELLSDRRMTKVLKLLRTSAATNGRKEVDLSDLVLLKDCLWNHAENREKVGALVFATLKKHSRLVPIEARDSETDPPTTGASDAATSGGIAHLLISPTRSRIKGFSGSGTAEDPLRITSADDLLAMDDEDIRNTGYYFVQTQDIDCTHISTWPQFSFRGHYNGNGKTIRNGHGIASGQFDAIQGIGIPTTALGAVRTVASVLASKVASIPTDSKSFFVFEGIKDSSVTHLRLEGCGLASTAQAARINRCIAIDAPLVGSTLPKTDIAYCRVWGKALVNGDVKETKITYCQVTGGALVNGNTSNKTQITRCEVIDGDALVWGTASETQITDCSVVMKCSKAPRREKIHLRSSLIDCVGLIANRLASGSKVERCFTSGTYSAQNRSIEFGGIAGHCEDSRIRQCAVGPYFLNGGQEAIRKRIANEGLFGNKPCKLENNAAIDSISGKDEPNGPDGKTVAAARFNQRFFEDSLGWDFVNTWRWDAAKNRPALRLEADTFRTIQPHAESSDSSMEDLLTRQIRGNIWL